MTMFGLFLLLFTGFLPAPGWSQCYCNLRSGGSTQIRCGADCSEAYQAGCVLGPKCSGYSPGGGGGGTDGALLNSVGNASNAAGQALGNWLFGGRKPPARDDAADRKRQLEERQKQEAEQAAADQEEARRRADEEEARRKAADAAKFQKSKGDLMEEWQGDQLKGAAEASPPPESEELGFDWDGGDKARQEGLALSHDLASLRDAALARARERRAAGEITEEELGAVKLGEIRTRLPEQGSSDAASYRQRLAAWLSNTRGWLKKANGEDHCFTVFDSAAGTCGDEGTVPGLKSCAHLATQAYNRCKEHP